MNCHSYRINVTLLIPLLLITILALQACRSGSGKLPVMGPKQNGEPHQIPPFAFINQDSQLVTEATFTGKAYVADFFFTSCPTVCPVLTRQMKRIYNDFNTADELLLLSHSIDTKHDTVARLKQYADNLEVETDRWHFVTGNRDDIFNIAESYFNIVVEDQSAPGGYDHTARLVLIDKNRHIRAFCNGTDEQQVDKFIRDIQTLLDEDEEK